jgi:zinc/manganese transport system substrate-binding protein
MNKKTLTYVILGIIAAIFVLSTASLLLRQPPKNDTNLNKKLTVVAAENFWGSIAMQIGGEHVSVTSVISDPSTDPHLYDSGAKDASAITNANIVIVNGLGYDDFMDKILGASQNNQRTVIRVSEVVGAQAGDNPHLWYDISRIGLVATTIQQKFSAADPANSAAYVQNLKDFLDGVQPLLATVQTISTTYAQAPVAYTERVPGYLLNLANLSVKSPATFASAIEDGNEPTPADQAAMLALINKKQIRALLYNRQADSLVTQGIRAAAIQNNIPVVAVTETIPDKNTTYQAWQQTQLNALLKALQATQ